MKKTPAGHRRETRPYKAQKLAQWTTTFGERVRHLRLERGWTQEAAAAEMRLDLKHLQKIEAGRLNVTLATVFRIADGFAVSVERLLLSADVQGPGRDVATLVGPEPPDQVLLCVGARVAEARLRRRWSQKRLADRVGLSLSTVEQVEAGKQNVSLRSLAMLGQALGVPVAALLSPGPSPAGSKPRASKAR